MRQPDAQRLVLCHGCFDVLHLGHKRHLEEARALGDRLVVSITPDQHVNKGTGRPIFTAEQRREMLLALDCVDDVVISEGPDATGAINALKPAFYVKGLDYDGSDDPSLQREIEAAQALGGAYHVTASAKWSSTRIITHDRLSDEANRYLDGVRGRGWLGDIRAAFKRADQLRIAFVGETIIDEYRYVSALAKPSKEFCLATVENGKGECFLGGGSAAALHGDWANVTVVTDDGEPIKKTRFVDADFNRKVFEVYSKTRLELSGERRGAFESKLYDAIDAAEAVIVFDFGHGLMDELSRSLTIDAKFLAVNAQTNAGNYGFNPVTKYSRADLVCIDMPEAQLATGMQHEPEAGQLAAAFDRYERVIITRGRNGASAMEATSFVNFYDVPAFSSRAIDTMGAGDAFLAVTAPLVAAGLDLECAAFVGNVAGAIKTDIVGHRSHVTRNALMSRIEELLA